MTRPSLPPREMRALDIGLARAAAALDREIAASGGAGRVAGRVLARATARPVRRAAWVAIAATMLIAACLGSLADLALIGSRDGPRQELVVLDPLVFGPTELDQR